MYGFDTFPAMCSSKILPILFGATVQGNEINLIQQMSLETLSI